MSSNTLGGGFFARKEIMKHNELKIFADHLKANNAKEQQAAKLSERSKHWTRVLEVHHLKGAPSLTEIHALQK